MSATLALLRLTREKPRSRRSSRRYETGDRCSIKCQRVTGMADELWQNREADLVTFDGLYAIPAIGLAYGLPR
jgi:hypothetical protein